MSKRTAKPGNLQKDLEELTDLLKRTQADFDNYRRRADEERIALMDFAKAEVVKNLLPLIDDLERALNHLPKDLAKHEWAKGVASVGKRVHKTLADMGIEKIATVGKPFDPHLHEAVGVEGDGEREIVAQELQPGYKLGDEIIRHAIVKVRRR